MKSINLKVIIMILAAGLFYSCKDNQDGYSDEIKTNQNPTDKSTQTVSDTSRVAEGVNAVNGVPSNGPGENETNTTNTNTKNTGSSSTGTGSGPGPSPKDGAVYAKDSGVQKDSTNPKLTQSKKTPAKK